MTADGEESSAPATNGATVMANGGKLSLAQKKKLKNKLRKQAKK